MSFPPPTPKQARVLWYSLTAMAVAALVLLIALILWGLAWLTHRLSPVVLPVAFALILAYILDPLVDYFVKKKIPRMWSIVLVFLLALILAGALIGSVVPGIISESQRLVREMPNIVQKVRVGVDKIMRGTPMDLRTTPMPDGTNRPVLQAAPAPGTNTNTSANTNVVRTEEWILTHTEKTNATGQGITNAIVVPMTEVQRVLEAPFSEIVMPKLAHALGFIVKWVAAQLSNVTTWVEFLIGFVLVPVYLFYFLLEKKGINRSWPDYLPIQESRAKDELVFVLRAINDCMIVFFRGQVLVALCVGTMLAIAYLVMGLNYAVLLGVVAGVLGIVPYLGTIVSLALALTVAGIQFGDWTHPLIVLGIAAVVKLLEDFVIAPKIIGDRSGLHPLTIILAVMVGTTLVGGFLGALLAIPLTAVLRTLMFRYVWKHRPPKTKAAAAAGS